MRSSGWPWIDLGGEKEHGGAALLAHPTRFERVTFAFGAI
jgi:hypothetical protein